MLEERLLSLVERAARDVERELRGDDDLGGSLHVAGDSCERGRVEITEANVCEVGGEEIEDGLHGRGNGGHETTEHTFSYWRAQPASRSSFPTA